MFVLIMTGTVSQTTNVMTGRMCAAILAFTPLGGKLHSGIWYSYPKSLIIISFQTPLEYSTPSRIKAKAEAPLIFPKKINLKIPH